MAEPFDYAHLLFLRWVVLRKEPARDEISLLLYAFMEWGRPAGVDQRGAKTLNYFTMPVTTYTLNAESSAGSTDGTVTAYGADQTAANKAAAAKRLRKLADDIESGATAMSVLEDGVQIVFDPG